MAFFSTTKREPDYKPPKVTWHRVKVIGETSGFLYRGRDGQMHRAQAGEIHEIDAHALFARQRNVQELK